MQLTVCTDTWPRVRRASTSASTVSSDEEMVSARQRHQSPSTAASHASLQSLARPPLAVYQSPLTVSARMPTAQSCIDIATIGKILVLSIILAVAAMYFAFPKRTL